MHLSLPQTLSQAIRMKGHRILSLAKSREALSDLLQTVEDVLYFGQEESILCLYPEKLYLALPSSVSDTLCTFDDYDVFELLPSGQLINRYRRSSSDVVLNVTDQCTCSCIMCPSPDVIRRNGSAPDIPYLMELVRHIPADTSHVTITGGEPFLAGKPIFTLFELLRQKMPCTDFLLLTNGRIFCLDEYVQLLIKTLPDSALIGIPIHGSCGQKHDAIMQMQGAFRQTCKGIENLLHSGFSVEIRIVISKLTADDLDAIASLIIKRFPTVHSVKMIGLEMLGSAALNQEKIWIPYSEAFAASRQAVLQLIQAGIDVFYYNFPLCAVDPSFWMLCRKSITDYKVRFPALCQECSVQDACGGVFAGTLRLCRQDLHPVKDLMQEKKEESGEIQSF